MGNFKYTYNIEEFDKFYQSRLAPELQALAKKKMLPWKSKATAQEAFNITCSLLGRFSPYEGKSSENTYNFLKDLRLFPDFLHVKYNGCFSGHSAGKAFDAKSMELYKNDGKKDVLVWRGVLVSTQYHNRTFGRVLFRKHGLNVDNPDTIKLIFNKKNYEDIIDKTILRKSETYCDVVNANYHITFTNPKDQCNFSDEMLCKKICTVIKKYSCNVSFSVLNNNLFLAISAADTESTYTENGWFDFKNNFSDENFMKDIFQQFETVVMTLKLLNS